MIDMDLFLHSSFSSQSVENVYQIRPDSIAADCIDGISIQTNPPTVGYCDPFDMK